MGPRVPAAAADHAGARPEGSGRSGQLSGRPAACEWSAEPVAGERSLGSSSRPRTGSARFSARRARRLHGDTAGPGHGAGGDVDAVDLVAVRAAVLDAGAGVALVTQPYRVAGPPRRRRRPGSSTRPGSPSSPNCAAGGGRLARRRRPVQRRPGRLPHRGRGGAAGSWRSRSRCTRPAVRSRPGPTNCAPGVPTLVVNGDRDPFGIPGLPTVHVEVVSPGETHALSKDPAGATRCGWLAQMRPWRDRHRTGSVVEPDVTGANRTASTPRTTSFRNLPGPSWSRRSAGPKPKAGTGTGGLAPACFAARADGTPTVRRRRGAAVEGNVAWPS